MRAEWIGAGRRSHSPALKADRALAKSKQSSGEATPIDELAQGPRRTLTREDWVAAARKVLEKRGIAEVKIDRLARQMKVTRGSFYFHFASLKDLQNDLLEEWRRSNCAPFHAMAELEVSDGVQFFSDIVHVWVDEKPFSPKLDLAIRDWARTSKEIDRQVNAIDELRIALLVRSFRLMGYGDDESIVRARITYFHQIGQYALSFKEPPDIRKRYQPLFGDVLLGPLAKSP
ncbi:MAG: TetR/AcrR family transcriptional regulator [Rhizobium sp.]|nr:TetR/AcrR family transcriptional regulator [Rhizobium sp.]